MLVVMAIVAGWMGLGIGFRFRHGHPRMGIGGLGFCRRFRPGRFYRRSMQVLHTICVGMAGSAFRRPTRLRSCGIAFVALPGMRLFMHWPAAFLVRVALARRMRMPTGFSAAVRVPAAAGDPGLVLGFVEFG